MPRSHGNHGTRRLLLLAGLLLVALLLVGTGAVTVHQAPSGQTVAFVGAPALQRHFNVVIHIPAEYPTIQAGVNAAKAGDLVLISPGIYHEAVRVTTPSITIRGVDRNGTVLDGESRLGNAFTVNANNVVIENMTVHHYVGNGFFWEFVHGYRGSYLTAWDNGDYGIYAFGSTFGEFDHDYASGSPDSGFYIGQCFPCDAVITNVHSEWNALGYSGTNAGGSLVIENSEWDENGAGILPNTLDTEKNPPEHGASIIGNDVHDNGNPAVPSFALEYPALGVGIGMPGGDLNYVSGNHVYNNSSYGILVSGTLDNNLWLASGNVIEGNHVTGSGIADLVLGAPSGANNCFSNNQAATTLPALLEVTHACGTPLPLDGGGDISITLTLLSRYLFASGSGYHRRDYRTVPAPPVQQNMPDITAGPAPIINVPITFDDQVNGGLPTAVGKGGTGMLAPLGFTGYTVVQVLLGVYGNWSLFALYAVWLAVALYELSQRKEESGRKRLAWGTLIVGIPIIGAIIYFFAGGSRLSRGFRLALVVGAPLLCLAITIALMVVASYTL
jgi:Right handed beta helix region/Phospholipase_D-nuclease N-terminal